MDFELTPCATCTLSDSNHKGKSHVSHDSSEAVAAEVSMTEPFAEAGTNDVRLDLMADFLRQMLSLPAITRDIVATKMVSPEKPLSCLAELHNISVQAVHNRLKRALVRFPVLKQVIKMRERA